MDLIMEDKKDTVLDFLNKLTDNGKIKYYGIGEPNDFKKRYELWKDYIQKELPEFTLEEIVKFNKHFHNFKEKVYIFNGFETALEILEKELENKNTKL